MKHLFWASLFLPIQVFACSCLQGGTAEHYDWAPYIFTGTVTDIKQDPESSNKDGILDQMGETTVTFDIQKVWKGDISNPTQVITHNTGNLCGLGQMFTSQGLGKSFIVYATRNRNGGYRTTNCSGTGLAENHPYTNWLFSNAVANGFSDINTSYPYFEGVEYMRQQQIVRGYDDSTFRPENNINRAELTKIIVESQFAPAEIQSCTETNFSDVPEDAWFMPYVCTAKRHNIINGYPDGTFKPVNSVNFVEAAKIVVEALELQPSDTENPWYAKYVDILSLKKSIPLTVIHLDQNITRGEMAEMLFRLMTQNTSKKSLIYTNGKLLATDQASKSDAVRLIEASMVTDVLAGKSTALFFYANWCPTCRSLKNDIDSVTETLKDYQQILLVDFDNSHELKQKFNVTNQHSVIIFNDLGEETDRILGATIEWIQDALK